MDAPVPLESPPCPICEGEEHQTELTGLADRIWKKPGTFQLQQCTRCGLVSTRPRPTPESLAFYYEDTYSAESGDMRDFQIDSDGGRWLNNYRVAVLNKVLEVGKDTRLLDVGCSYGGFLRVIRERTGCQCWGIELDEQSIAQAALPEEIQYKVGKLADTDFGDQRFDVITFYQSLEHHPDPLQALETARSLLAPGGIVTVEVPNYRSFWRWVFGRFWLPLLIPQHLFHFTPASLTALAEKAGLQTVLHQTLFYPFEGIASLGLWATQGRAQQSGLEKGLLGIVFLVLFGLVEIPSQLVLRILGISGHQVLIARKA